MIQTTSLFIISYATLSPSPRRFQLPFPLLHRRGLPLFSFAIFPTVKLKTNPKKPIKVERSGLPRHGWLSFLPPTDSILTVSIKLKLSWLENNNSSNACWIEVDSRHTRTDFPTLWSIIMHLWRSGSQRDYDLFHSQNGPLSWKYQQARWRRATCIYDSLELFEMY